MERMKDGRRQPSYLRSIGVTNAVSYIAEDFDDPLPEDFLIIRLPPEFK